MISEENLENALQMAISDFAIDPDNILHSEVDQISERFVEIVKKLKEEDN